MGAEDKAKAEKAAAMSNADGVKANAAKPAAQKDKEKTAKDKVPETKELTGGDYKVPGVDETIEVDLKKKSSKGKKKLIKRLSKVKAVPTKEAVEDKQAKASARRDEVLKNDKVMPVDLDGAKAKKAALPADRVNPNKD